MTTPHEHVMLIYQWFSSAMRKAGRKESFPKGTDPRKTYKYRAIEKFAQNVEKWGFDNSTTKAMVESVVAYGKKKGLLTKGTMILNMKSVLEICLQELERKSEETENIVEAIKRCHAYLTERGIETSVSLASSERSGGMPRLETMIASGKMPRAYLAVSRIARSALLKLENRDDYPGNRELRKMRARLLYDARSRERLEEILGGDLDTSGMVGSVKCKS